MNNDIIKIESEILKVEITLDGGTFSSIIDKRNGEELQFQGDERSWKDKDMVIFPFIGGMPDGKYMANGAEYQMSRHGFCRHKPFTFVTKTDNEATIKFTSNEETKEIYPYDFTLYLTYKVSGKDISLSYKIVNEGKENMYFYLGGHLAFLLDGTDEPGGKEETKGNFIALSKELKTYYALGETFIKEKKQGSFKTFEVDKALMKEYRTLLVETNGDCSLVLKKAGGREIEFRSTAPVLGVWSFPETGKYVCIEPWWGLCGFEDNETEISKKPFINEVKPNAEFNCGYEITVK